ncbi:MAG: NADH-quinone oxidoreductase subunit L [Deltaproteobacteria bacterium HGW-Deltaproteobacteria-14]|jgi:NADH-quinone oxidoreductase subunit L|nr:MAG: NADH-quinone oxidoreductase subunit L [Deltaproteobacteria bacterium HGW-Deltaproteobacteria-14]
MSHANLAVATLLAPLIAFFVALVFFRKKHDVAAGIAILGGLVSLVGSVWLLLDPAPAPELITAPWFEVGGIKLAFGALLDGRTLLMGAVVGLITMCVLVYSLGYMKHDPGKGRFFAFLGLFEWAMLSFSYAPNLLQGFIFWELVGLASFLLIGFWYEKPSAVAAAKKAFIMTRIGDVGMFVGLILLFGDVHTLDILEIGNIFAAPGLPEGVSAGRVELLAGLLFLGVMGKSAQFPLHTWLPDAMEGPTPVSALLHSATMVAAGVFLFARFHELFLDAPTMMTIILAIAVFTALISSTMAMAANDMKKILAFSSISQLGFMIIGLAAGSLFAGLFHLMTHALFKALLFLTAGAYIHEFGTNDIVAIGRAGGRKMRVTTLGLFAGGFALAGVPIFAGFWSKEVILGALHGPGAEVFLIGAYAAAFMTAYYTFRMIFLIVLPNTDSKAIVEEPAGSQGGHGPADHGHAHGAPKAPGTMRAPILVLSIGAVIAGLPFFGDAVAGLLGRPHEAHHAAITEMILPVAIVLAGVALAWLDFGGKKAPQRGIVAWFPPLERALKNRWYIDAFYRKTIIRFVNAFAALMYGAETRGFDGAGDALGRGTMKVGVSTAKSHTGRLPIFVGTAVAVLAIVSLSIALG